MPVLPHLAGLREQVDGVDAVGQSSGFQGEGLAVLGDATLPLGGAEPEEDLDPLRSSLPWRSIRSSHPGATEVPLRRA